MEFPYDQSYFKDKTAVVTGGGGGLGLALAEEMLDSGASKIVIADINQDRLDEAMAHLNKTYDGRVKAIVCDVTKEDEVKDLIAQSHEFFDGSLDLLFNNAGAAFGGWFDDLSDDDWEDAFDLNFRSALYGCRAAIPLMLEAGNGQIVNIISGIALVPMAKQSRYAATKAALNGLSLALRTEYWDDNIKISSATPGTTATHIFADANQEIPPDAQTPHYSASRILDGVAKNNRIIFGSDSDAESGKWAFHPDAQVEYDQYLIPILKARKEGGTGL
ncbi:MAG: SDR family oxidoreductase [Actinomycetia bacterium]|nr:SDR family oxidoreductase [Actinomycetes bacterium]